MGRGASSPKPHSETAAGDRKVRRLNLLPATFACLPEKWLPAYRFVHLQLYVGLEAEEFVRPGGGELFGAVCEEEEVAEEESPQLPAAFGFVQAAAVQQLARPQAVSQRVEDQVLEENASTTLSSVLVREVPQPLQAAD